MSRGFIKYQSNYLGAQFNGKISHFRTRINHFKGFQPLEGFCSSNQPLQGFSTA